MRQRPSLDDTPTPTKLAPTTMPRWSHRPKECPMAIPISCPSVRTALLCFERCIVAPPLRVLCHGIEPQHWASVVLRSLSHNRLTRPEMNQSPCDGVRCVRAMMCAAQILQRLRAKDVYANNRHTSASDCTMGDGPVHLQQQPKDLMSTIGQTRNVRPSPQNWAQTHVLPQGPPMHQCSRHQRSAMHLHERSPSRHVASFVRGPLCRRLHAPLLPFLNDSSNRTRCTSVVERGPPIAAVKRHIALEGKRYGVDTSLLTMHPQPGQYCPTYVVITYRTGHRDPHNRYWSPVDSGYHRYMSQDLNSKNGGSKPPHCVGLWLNTIIKAVDARKAVPVSHPQTTRESNAHREDSETGSKYTRDPRCPSGRPSVHRCVLLPSYDWLHMPLGKRKCLATFDAAASLVGRHTHTHETGAHNYAPLVTQAKRMPDGNPHFVPQCPHCPPLFRALHRRPPVEGALPRH